MTRPGCVWPARGGALYPASRPLARGVCRSLSPLFLLLWHRLPALGGGEGQGGEKAVLAVPLGFVHGLIRGVEEGRGVRGIIGALDGPCAETQVQAQRTARAAGHPPAYPLEVTVGLGERGSRQDHHELISPVTRDH